MWAEVTQEERLALVQDSWDKLGYTVRATGKYVWVRTLPFSKMTDSGKLWLAPKLQSFHGEISAHLQTVRGVVLSAGPIGLAPTFEVGSMIEFQRLYFGYHEKLNRETQEYIGFVDANQVLWHVAAPEAA